MAKRKKIPREVGERLDHGGLMDHIKNELYPKVDGNDLKSIT